MNNGNLCLRQLVSNISSPLSEPSLFTNDLPVSPNHHALGTAAMMSRNLGGVVDAKLRVYGTSNLRVVDASVIPLQISGHLTATLYALADRAAAIILGEI